MSEIAILGPGGVGGFLAGALERAGTPVTVVARERVRGEPALVVPLLNGLDHLAVLRERFGAAVVAGSIRIEADRPETGHVVHTSPFLGIEVAPRTPPVETFAATVRAADVAVDVYDSEPRVMWGKLVRLNAIALATSAWDAPMGEVRDRPEVRAAVEEGAAVAQADGAHVT